MQETNVNASGSSSNFNPNSELPQVGTTLLPDANTTTHSQHGPIVRSRSHVDNFNHTVLQTSTPLAEIRAIDTSSRGSIGNNSSRNSSKDTPVGQIMADSASIIDAISRQHHEVVSVMRRSLQLKESMFKREEVKFAMEAERLTLEEKK